MLWCQIARHYKIYKSIPFLKVLFETYSFPPAGNALNFGRTLSTSRNVNKVGKSKRVAADCVSMLLSMILSKVTFPPRFLRFFALSTSMKLIPQPTDEISAVEASE